MLTQLQIRAAEARDKPYKLADRDGLYLVVLPSGVKSWRYNHLVDRKARTKTYGQWPALSLADARGAHAAYRAGATDGDPAPSPAAPSVPTFEKAAQAWLADYLPTIRKGKNQLSVPASLEKHVYPKIGAVRLDLITRADLVDLVKGIYNSGRREIAYKVAQRICQVFDHAQDNGRIDTHPASRLSRVLGPKQTAHHPCVPPTQAGALLRAIATYPDLITRHALLLAAHTFVRTDELRSAPWAEFDRSKRGALWVIPGERIKMAEAHEVPLSRQVLQLLTALHQYTGEGTLLLPGANTPRKPISENTMLFALYRLGYKGVHTVHGFRALASTVLNESGLWRPDVIERQLDHRERDGSRRPYNRAEYLDERRRMMQWWSDWLDAQVGGSAA